jgi:hypothetical protein
LRRARLTSAEVMKMNTKGMALAPSKHLRSTLGFVLGAVLTLSACGPQEVGAAAIVDGKVIKDKDVQTVALQLNTLAQGEQKLSTGNVVLSLILAPYVSSEAARAKKSVSDSAVRKVIAKVGKPSPSTMEFVRMQLALQALDEASRASILTKIAKARITVNPRYGTFDAKQVALVASSPNWIKASATPGAK